MTDGTRKKIAMPTWHIPYLEKHNIYKLFYELARELVIQQPEDHVFYLKYLLTNAVKNIHVPHVILLGSPKINMTEISRLISEQTNQLVITEELLCGTLKKGRHEINSSELILGIQTILNSNLELHSKYGWLMVDCIKTKKEAQNLIRVGILPTHVIFLVSPYGPKLTDLMYCNIKEGWPEYRKNIYGLREEVYLEEFMLPGVVKKCLELIKIENVENGPSQPRVLLLGPRGSGRKTQAKLLEEKLNLIHVDFEYLLCQAWVSDSEIGKQLRRQGNYACFHAELLTKVLSKRLLELDCLKQGWVLTGYPFNVTDFKYLDCIETPPNRVIFLECDLSICHERLSNRRVNVHTGSVTKIDIDSDEITRKRLKLHPKDANDITNAELHYYCTQYGALRKYCGGTANVINADQPERWVHESIAAIIMRDVPICSPRDPFTDGKLDDLDMHYKYFESDKVKPCREN